MHVGEEVVIFYNLFISSTAPPRTCQTPRVLIAWIEAAWLGRVVLAVKREIKF